jgi:uncharacterized membrane protein
MTDSYPAKSLDEVIQGDYSVKISEYINLGWQTFQKNGIGFIAYFILVSAVNILLQQLPTALATPATLLILPILYAGFFIVAFKILQEQNTRFVDFFQGFQNWVHLILANIAMSVLIFIGFLLFIIPGIYLSISYIFTVPIIVDRQVNFWEALEASRRIITKDWFSWFGFGLALLGINLISVLIYVPGAIFFQGSAIIILFNVGFLLTVPMTICTTAAAYQKVVTLGNKNL